MKLRSYLRFVVPFLASGVAIAMLVAQLVFFNGQMKAILEFEEETFNQRIKTRFSLSMSKLEAVLLSLLNNEGVLQAFASGDRSTLLSLVEPVAKRLAETANVGQIHFHTKDLRSFLRSNDPSRYGDLLDFRKDVIHVQSTKKPLKTAAIGKSGFGLRVIYPVFHNGEFIGSVEAIEYFDEKFLQAFPGQNEILLLKDEKGNPTRISVKESPDAEELTKYFDIEGMLKGKHGHHLSGNYAFVDYEITDFNDETIAWLLTKLDLSDLISPIRTSLHLQITIIVALGVSVLIFNIFYSRGFSAKLHRVMAHFDNLSKGDFSARIDKVTERDEFDSIQNSLAEFSNSLRAALATVVDKETSVNSQSKTLASNVEQFMKVTFELSKLADDVNASAQSVASSVEEVTSGVDEVASSAQNIAKAAQELSEKANSMLSAARTGEEGINSITNAVSESRERAKVTERIVLELSESAKDIGEIVETINSIAEQTNLLALNAAIEAARAGEAGRGFAVVADEIRKLAEESKRATGRIVEILGGIQRKSELATKATSEMLNAVERAESEAKHVGESILSVLRQIEAVTMTVDNFAASSQEMSASAEEMTSALNTASRAISDISNRIEKLNAVSKEQVRDFERLRELSEALESVSEDLRNVIGRFRIS